MMDQIKGNKISVFSSVFIWDPAGYRFFFSSGFEELNVSFILVAPSICTCELCNCSVIHEMFNHPYFELKENKYLLFHMRQSSKICICLHHFCCCSWGDK